MPRLERDQLVRFVLVAVPSLIGATIAVVILQDQFGVPNPSAIYLLAVVACAVVFGTWAAAAVSVSAFLLYNFLFVEPRYTLNVTDLGQVVNLLLLLFVGFVVGQLAARQRERADAAITREREARALFRVSRELATRSSTDGVLGTIADVLRQETAMDRVWIGLGDGARDRVVADTSAGDPLPAVAIHEALQRMPGETPARWARVHQPQPPRSRTAPAGTAYRVRIEAAGERYGSIWGLRGRGHVPNTTETRLLALAADQIGQAIHQDRLGDEAAAAEIARQSDALKSALLQSVSHDLRTPLATIRAAAGTLRRGLAIGDDDQRESAEAIDREVEYLNRIVTNLLDLSRIEAGALRAERGVFEIDDLVRPIVERVGQRHAGRRLELAVDAPPVSVDPVFLGEAVTNAIENAVKYTPPDTPIRVSARALDPRTVRLTVEDGGAGVPDETLPRLFDKFYRVPGGPPMSRTGTGIGLAVVRGLVEAMGGRVAARRSELGGLAIDLDVPAAAAGRPPIEPSSAAGPAVPAAAP